MGLRRLPAPLRVFLPVAALLIGIYALGLTGSQSWDGTTQPDYGVNFSCKRADWLGYDCHELFARVLDDLGARHVRLSAYWSDIEAREGIYDFTDIDALLDMAETRGARVTVSIGMKGQRYPEYWLPGWLRDRLDGLPTGYADDQEELVRHVFPYLEAAARHIGAHPAVEALMVENEPFVSLHTYVDGWHLRHEFVARQIATVRAADPVGHPIVISHASWLKTDETWRWILSEADVLSQSVYVKRQRGPRPWLYIFPYRIGPWTPDLPGQARAARAQGKQVWIGELQAEPFEQHGTDPRQMPSHRLASFSARWLRHNARLADRSGVTRAYLWGVEWWAYLADRRGEPEVWDTGRDLLRRSMSGGGSAPAGRQR
jgi:hypothetical protein